MDDLFEENSNSFAKNNVHRSSINQDKDSQDQTFNPNNVIWINNYVSKL